MDYTDFLIEISADGLNRYRVEAQCAAGEAKEEFLPPYRRDELASSLWGLPDSELTRDMVASDAGDPQLTAEEIGDRIFGSMLPPKIRSLFNNCLGAAEDKGNGMRIKLRLDPMDSRVSWLGLLPWEMLYWADRAEFLGLSRQTPISRYLDAPYPLWPVPMPQSLRILAALARPRGVQRLNLQQEQQQLQKSWGEGAGALVDPLERATLDALRERLCQRWDILHFMGHGGFDEQLREGYLVFEDEDGAPVRVPDRRLQILLQGAERPRLLVLNACETARTAADGEQETAVGAAPLLVRAGAPAVAAMLHPISDRAALLFNRTFHGRLVAGDPVDVAIAEARRAIHVAMPGLEWAKPVLFMRLPDGRLFENSTSTEEEKEPEPSTETVTEVDDLEADNVDVIGRQYCTLLPHGSAEEGKTRVQVTMRRVRAGDFSVVGVRHGNPSGK